SEQPRNGSEAGNVRARTRSGAAGRATRATAAWELAVYRASFCRRLEPEHNGLAYRVLRSALERRQMRTTEGRAAPLAPNERARALGSCEGAVVGAGDRDPDAVAFPDQRGGR